MSLSSSTLSLKFMQRGAARAGTSTPTSANTKTQQPPQPSPLAGPSAPSTPVPVSGYTPNSIDRPEEVSRALAIEEQAKWFIPRPPRRRDDGAAGDVKWQFEASYAPFLSGYDAGSVSEPEEDGADERQAGGGRMTFGGFGKKTQEEKEGDDGASDGDKDEEMVDERAKVTRAAPKGQDKKDKRDKKEKAIAAKDKPRTFLRPAMSPPPSHPKPSSDKPHNRPNVPAVKQASSSQGSQAPKKKQKRPPPESPAKPSMESVSKKVKLEPAALPVSKPPSGGISKKAKVETKPSVNPVSTGKKASSTPSGGTKSLDERQKLLKAQKKAEKRKAGKAGASKD